MGYCSNLELKIRGGKKFAVTLERTEVKDENGKTKQVSVSVPMYEQTLCYDKIDVSDLTPYAYLQYLQSAFNSK